MSKKEKRLEDLMIDSKWGEFTEYTKSNSVYPSSLGKCLRSLYYLYMGEDRKPATKTKALVRALEAADSGNAVHDKVRKRWDKMGILLDPYWDKKKKEFTERKLPMVRYMNGRFDSKINFGNVYVVEVKSKNGDKFYKAIKEGGVREEKIQLGYYMWRMMMPGILFYHNRDTEEQHSFIFDLGCDWMLLAKERAMRIYAAIDKGEPPDKEENKYGCKFCAYGVVCKGKVEVDLG